MKIFSFLKGYIYEIHRQRGGGVDIKWNGPNSTQVSADKLHLDLWKRGSDQHIVNFKRKSPHEGERAGKGKLL